MKKMLWLSFITGLIFHCVERGFSWDVILIVLIFLIKGVLDTMSTWDPAPYLARPAPSLPSSLPVQVIPVSRATHEVRRSRGFAVNELVFQMQAPPLGFTTYTVTLQKNSPQAPPPKHRTPAVIQNQVCWAVVVSFTGVANQLQSLQKSFTLS